MLQTMIIKTTGEIVTVSPDKGKTFSLRELQDTVGGFIEIIRLDNHKAFMVLHEEGKLIGLPINSKATKIFQEQYGTGDYIVGDVLIAQYNQID